MAFFLPPGVDIFPHPLCADEDGLLAIGGSLTQANLILAYNFGIFPWNTDEDPLLWWFTHPRCVLFPDKLKVSRSMKRLLNKDRFNVTYDTVFPDVINACRNVRRKGQDNTWITDEIEEAFIELHKSGWAHSVEVWDENRLVGGLYGLAFGKIFYGESMFTLEPNASKFALIKLVERLRSQNFKLLDCQQKTDHLISLGAETISGELFLSLLKKNILETFTPGKWS